MLIPWVLTVIIVSVMVVLSFIMLLARRYKRCPSNSIMVIYGKVGGGDSAHCIHGGAAFIIPLLQDYAFLSLEPIQIEVPLKDALSMENIRVHVPSVFTVAIGTDPVTMNNAAIRLLSLTQLQIKKQAEDIIFGQLRQVIASMRIEEINRDRDHFLNKVQASLEPELRKIGLVLINVNITDITDASGYIDAIGKKAASEAVQQARADVAEQEKLGEIRVAENVREKEVRVAEANKNKQVGIRQAEREQAVSIADLEKEQKIGEQTAAFQRDAQVKEAEREMRIAVASANARAIEGENLSKAAIAGTTANLKVKEAEAFQLAETQAEVSKAAVLEARNKALAKAALADAERVEMERRAELEAPAKAQKARTIVEAEAEAQKRRIEAEGEASAIFARLEAQARGQYEMLRQKAEGLRAIVDACGGANQAFQMLMLEHLDNLAEQSAKAISNIKFDKVVVWDNGAHGNGQAGDGKGSTAQFLSSMAQVLPPMLHTMRDIAGIEVPEYLAKLVDDEGKTAVFKTTGAPAPAEKTKVDPAAHRET
ncbi:MAG: flotillin family protein [Candidatus Hydrogenedentes bacterium]|nr:flotillin family protein [Candidatus Hydrogenedentota bacterium]